MHTADVAAIMIENALNPLAPNLAVIAVRQHRRVFDGDRDLVVEAIRHPATQLACRESACSHHQMKWVMNMVAATAAAQLGFKFFLAPGGERACHRSMSIPSRDR